jgi:hypothetical protein
LRARRLSVPAGYPFPGPFPTYGQNEFQFFGKNNPAAQQGASLPQTAQTGYNSVYHPVSYSPASQYGYHRSNYTPQYNSHYGYYPYYRR